MKFAKFHAGQTLEAGPYVVSEAEIRQFANAYAPQRFYTNAETPIFRVADYSLEADLLTAVPDLVAAL